VNDPQSLHIIAKWLAKLAAISNLPADLSAKDLKLKFETEAQLLGAALPSGAFTDASLAHVAEGNPWFPPYDTIRARLAEWWRDHRPASAPMIADDRAKPAGWDQRDGEWLDFWHRRGREIANLDNPALAEFQRTRLASLIRQMSPRARIVIDGPQPGRDMSPERAQEAVERVLRSASGYGADEPYRAPQRRENAFLSEADVHDMRERAGIRHSGITAPETRETFRQRHEAGRA